MAVHPSALIDGSAVLGDGVEVGPFSIVGPNVTLGDGVRLGAQVVIQQDTTIGARPRVSPFAVLGGDPQHMGYKGEPVRVEIGSDCVIRENVTVNRGTAGGGGLTRVGDRVLLMNNAHVGHDVFVGDDTVLATSATIGGHAVIGSRVFMGGLSAVHQFGRVGDGAIVGGLAAVTRDVIPYGSVWGNHARLQGLNLVGLKRKGYGKVEIRALLAAYRDLFEGEGVFEERLERVAATTELPEIQQIVAFIREGGRRPLCLPEA